MIRAIVAVASGYAVMFLCVVGGVVPLELALGLEGVFKPGSYEVTGTFLVWSLVLGIIAAVAGGAASGLIARRSGPVLALGAVVLVLGAFSAAMHVGRPDPGPRPPNPTFADIMQNARQSPAYFWSLPLIGAAFAIGSGLLVVRMRSKR